MLSFKYPTCLLLFANLLLAPLYLAAQNITYTEATNDFANPERGFYRYSATSSSNYDVLDAAELAAYRDLHTPFSAGYQIYSTLVFRYFKLEEFVDIPIRQGYLDSMQMDFNAARVAGLKLIPRFTYTTEYNGNAPYGDAPKARVLEHIAQIKPLLQSNKDVIATLQMGFIGIWGEQYYTDHFGFAGDGPLSSTNIADRNEVLEALLAALPTDRMVQARIPQYKQHAVYGVGAATTSNALTSAEAYQLSNKARIGHHNDCFLTSYTDYGTYLDLNDNGADTINLKPYLAADSKYTVVGGETCADINPRSNCAGDADSGDADIELRRFHYSYLNSQYNNEVNDDWINICMEDIKKNLGYRFVLESGTIPTTATTGNDFTVNLSLKNVGYAAPYNPRKVELVLRNTTTPTDIFTIPLEDDPRLWLPNTPLSIQHTFCVANNIPAGNYDLFLNLPDPELTLYSRPEYAIRLANQNVWEAATGYNLLATNISISQGNGSCNPVTEVNLGAGSYNLAPPPGGAVPQHSSGATAYPQVTNNFNQPIQTNDWWTSLLYKYYQNQNFLWEIHSWKLFAHPLAFTANRYGLDVKYPDQASVENYYGWDDAKYQYAMSNQDFTIGVEGLDMGVTDTVKTESYGDWHVKAEWKDANGKMLQATMAHGSPYAYFETNEDDVYLRFLFGHSIDNTIGSNIVGFTTQGHHYAIFAPSGTTWNTNSNYTFDENNLVNGTPNNFTRSAFKCDLNGKRYFSIAVLPDNSLATLQEFAQHAFAFIEETELTWNYDAATATLTNTFTTQTNPKEGTETNTLQALYYHQWKHCTDINTNYTYQSPRGLMKVTKGSTFNTQLKNNGVLPVLPAAMDEMEKTILYQFIEDEYQVSNTYITTEDTYWQGKRFGRQADLITIADQVGHTTARDKFIADLQTELEDWFTAPDGESDRGYFYYDQNWNTLIGYPANFGSDTRVTDHHFHYGYFVKAAATIARFDPAWIADAQWGSMVKLLIKDVNNWDKTDEQFPFLRCFDAYAGHSWANGHANFHWGNDQEASSESINFAAWVYALGLYTADNELRDFGLFLYLNEAEAAEQYWFDKDGEVFPNSYGYKTATRIWGNGADKILGEDFEAESEYQLGINTFPIQAPLLYLGNDSALIATAYQEAATIDDGIGDLWEDIMWGYLAMARPAEALADYEAHTADTYYNTNLPWLPDVDGIYNDFSDRSLAPAQIYHWLYALDSLGIVDTTCADYPAAVVFKKDDHKNYVVDNSSAAELLVQFSDGEQMLVPANSTIVKKVNTSSCTNAEEAITIENETVVGNYVATTIQTQGSVSILAETTFKASDYVLLEPGFTTGTSSPFLAIIEDCAVNSIVESPVVKDRSNKGTLSALQEKIQQTALLVNIAPNPFSEQTTIHFHLPETGITTIQLLDILGRPIQIIKNELQVSGGYQLVVNTANLEAGAYFLSVRQGSHFKVKKLIKKE